MTKEEILQEQLDAMEKLLQLKQAIIDELEEKVRKLSTPPYTTIGGGGTVFAPHVYTPQTPCDLGVHDYPTPWYGVIPPTCKVCGKSAGNFNVTYGSNSITSEESGT